MAWTTPELPHSVSLSASAAWGVSNESNLLNVNGEATFGPSTDDSSTISVFTQKVLVHYSSGITIPGGGANVTTIKVTYDCIRSIVDNVNSYARFKPEEGTEASLSNVPTSWTTKTFENTPATYGLTAGEIDNIADGTTYLSMFFLFTPIGGLFEWVTSDYILMRNIYVSFEYAEPSSGGLIVSKL